MGSERLSSIVVTLPTKTRSAHVASASDATGPARRRGAVRLIAVGTLVALPILTTPDGRPFDLLEAADGHVVVLQFVPGDQTTTTRDSAAAAMSLAGRIETAAGRSFIISSRADAVADGGGALLLDRDGGFAYSLGLAEWDYERGCADLGRPVGLVLDEVGRVIAADLGGSPDPGRLVHCLPEGSRMHTGRVRTWR